MRNTLAVQFERILLEVEQRMSLRSLLVERKLKHLAQILEAREAQINQLVISLEGDQASVNLARKHLEVSRNTVVYPFKWTALCSDSRCCEIERPVYSFSAIIYLSRFY